MRVIVQDDDGKELFAYDARDIKFTSIFLLDRNALIDVLAEALEVLEYGDQCNGTN